MNQDPIQELKEKLIAVIEDWGDRFIQEVDITSEIPVEPLEAEIVSEEKRVLPEGKRAVRASSTGDRVYYIDEEKKTRQWVTNPDVLKKLGFELSDVAEVTEEELLRYQMAAAVYQVND